MCARPRVLLVNDDEDALFLLGRSITRALPEAEIALLRDAVTALDYFKTHHVDAIVTDNTMPHMDGLTFVKSVRAQNTRIPVLMVTNSTHLTNEANAAGVTAYLPCARWNDVGPVVATLLGDPTADPATLH
jgi:two-component system chemotaxis response regulator CheY